MENNPDAAVPTQDDASDRQHPTLDLSSLFEAPVMIYNATPFVEDAGEYRFLTKQSTTQQGMASESKDTPRKLRNGCVECTDPVTGQRTRIAGERSFGMLIPVQDLIEPSAEDETAKIDDALLTSMLTDSVQEKRQRSISGENTTQESNALCPIHITNTPQLLKKEHSEGVLPFSVQPSNKKMRSGENVPPSENTETVKSEDPFVICYPNFYVLNKEIIQKRNGQRGFCGNVEKIRVEMESLEDGYKWRKYGRKEVKGNMYPRNYFKCTYPNCMCRKQVEQNPKNPRMLIATYEGRHIHPPPFISQQSQRRPRR